MKDFVYKFCLEYGRNDYSEVCEGALEISNKEYNKIMSFYRKNPGKKVLEDEAFADLYDRCKQATIDLEYEEGAYDEEEVMYSVGGKTHIPYIHDYEEDDAEDNENDVVTRELLEKYMTQYCSLVIWDEPPK